MRPHILLLADHSPIVIHNLLHILCNQTVMDDSRTSVKLITDRFQTKDKRLCLFLRELVDVALLSPVRQPTAAANSH